MSLYCEHAFLALCSPSSKEGQTAVGLDTNDEIRSLKKSCVFTFPLRRNFAFFGSLFRQFCVGT